MMTIAYLNGNYLALSEARLSPLDRGFLFGDSVYEVIPVYNHKPFRLQAHLQRLHHSLTGIQLPLGKQFDWPDILATLIKRNHNYCDGNFALYLQISRGVNEIRDLRFPKPSRLTVFAYCMPPRRPNPKKEQVGYSAITTDNLRWRRCNIKANILLPNALSFQVALAAGADEAILIDEDTVLEATSSNIFICKSDKLYTPPSDEKILAGITRQVVVELATTLAIPCEQRVISLAELNDADEIWVTSSTKEIWPITKLNGNIVANGKPGPLWKQFIDHFQMLK